VPVEVETIIRMREIQPPEKRTPRRRAFSRNFLFVSGSCRNPQSFHKSKRPGLSVFRVSIIQEPLSPIIDSNFQRLAQPR
jgi:hypothetical protein